MNKRGWKEFLNLFGGCLIAVGIMVPIFIVVRKFVSPIFFPFSRFTAIIILSVSLIHNLWKATGEFYDTIQLEEENE